MFLRLSIITKRIKETEVKALLNKDAHNSKRRILSLVEVKVDLESRHFFKVSFLLVSAKAAEIPSTIRRCFGIPNLRICANSLRLRFSSNKISGSRSIPNSSSISAMKCKPCNDSKPNSTIFFLIEISSSEPRTFWANFFNMFSICGNCISFVFFLRAAVSAALLFFFLSSVGATPLFDSASIVNCGNFLLVAFREIFPEVVFGTVRGLTKIIRGASSAYKAPRLEAKEATSIWASESLSSATMVTLTSSD
mmetsp:Transcript_16493/g.24764  ORF Transcript_16493/g.24764 Transcript_16493/m.24764 type:complete len:251 (+) Transcript_16493:438-1190(+)